VCVCVCLQWICRSATLARQMEVQARQAQLSISGLWSQTTHSGVNNVEHGEQQHQRHGTKESIGGDGDLVGVSRNKDIALLQSLKVRYICDLMVEDRKVKYGMVLTSSEKVDKHSRYHSWFDLVAIPYVAAHVHVHMIAFSPLACGLVTCWLAPMCAALPRDVVVVGGGGDL
jgi:myotubularin-related protein 14